MPVQTKREIVLKVIKDKESVSKLAKEYKVARKTIYGWLKLYQNAPKRLKNEVLATKYVSGRNHHRFYRGKIKHAIINSIVKNPEQGLMALSRKLGIGRHAIYSLLKELSLSTPNERITFAKIYSGPGRLEQNIKTSLVKAVMDGETSISKIARENNICRKTVYDWMDRFQVDGRVTEKYVSGFAHHKALSPEAEQSILDKVVAAPALSIHALSRELPFSSHAIFNVLSRYSLTYKSARMAYAAGRAEALPQKAKASGIFGRVRSVWEHFIPNLAPAPPPSGTTSPSDKPGLAAYAKTFGATLTITFLIFSGILYWIDIISRSSSLGNGIGLIFATISLAAGSFFFFYSLKYYFTLAVVLSYSQNEGDTVASGGIKKHGGLVSWILGSKGNLEEHVQKVSGLAANLDHITLKRYPFISVQIPFYNEKYVAQRSAKAAINFDYGGDYEVILCDDSTDETTTIIRNFQKEFLGKGETLNIVKNEKEGWELSTVEVRPGVNLKHLHRTSRTGFKGGALRLALTLCDKRTEFVSVFDADFVPYPDSLYQFVKYFKAQNGGSEDYTKTKVAAVQGYQWHVLNKSENWITRGVRSEYAGSYVIERAGEELYGGLKQISGSVYMIRRDALEEVGWANSITEDFELTLKLYNAGYKVVYTPYIQAPAECVSTTRRLIRQRMRWAEGHSSNVKLMWRKLLGNPKLTIAEKFEFVYLMPYYLQALFFLVGTFSWVASETIFHARLPFWTSLWGWSLVLTNMLALPLMNAVGLFLEESEEKDYMGIASFVALSYILVPFQAYAALKGFLEKEEGNWFRTPKTGRVTDVFSKGTFARLIQGILPGRVGVVQENVLAQYLALATANNKFNSFSIKKKSNRYLGKAVLIILLAVSVTVYSSTNGVPEVLATNPTTPFVLSPTASSVLTGTTSWKLLDNTTATANSTTILSIANKGVVPSWFLYAPGVTTTAAIPGTACPTSASGKGWIFDTPFGGSGGHIATGTWTFYYNLTDNQANYAGYLEYCVYAATVSGGSVTSSRLLYDSSTDVTPPSTDVWIGGTSNSSYTTSSISQSTMTFNAGEYLYVDYYNDQTVTTTSGKSTSYTSTMNIGGSSVSTSMRIATPVVTIPEKVVYLWPLALFVPFLSGLIGKRRMTI